MKQQSTNQEGGKAKSNQIEIPSVSLPKGGGAIKSIDDKFQVNSANGTAGFNIPLPFSKARNEFMPAAALSYNSGSGNGSFGLGWDLDIPCISRKTSKKIPEYNDNENSDTFVFSNAEDLVPVLKKSESGNWILENGAESPITLYRPRVEGGFARIEQIKETTGNTYWKVTSKDNVISIYGKSDNAKICDPGNSSKIFKWLLEFSCDDKGSCIQYEYKKENIAGVPNTICERNRISGLAKFTNVYLKRIKYCNKSHFKREEFDFSLLESFTSGIEYLMELVLDYGEHDADNPGTAETTQWLCRPDAFSDYRAGFEIRTYRLCSRVLMFHHFKELGDLPYLVRSLNLNYKTGPDFTFLKSATQKAFKKNTNQTYRHKSLPPIEFTYEPLKWDTKVQSLATESIENLSVGLDDRTYKWIDFYGEGLAGILTEQANAWYYKANAGAGKLDPMKQLLLKPSLTGVNTGAISIQDIEANGQKFVVSNDLSGYFEFSPDNEWLPFRNFKEIPNIDLQNPNVKFLDLNGDGKADLLISEHDIFVWYASKGKDGFESHKTICKTFDEEKGPAITFADSTESIVLADMSGDGLTDIVRIRNGEIVYWPNLGYGRFGAKITMANAPVFDTTDNFNAKYLKLADLDGSGTTDIVYLGKDSFKIYFNQNGNSWTDESGVASINPLPFPEIDDHTNINIVDLLGNGTGCIVWSSPLPAYAANPLRFIDLMGGKKPHVMTGYKNNMGKEVHIDYLPSTSYYLNDKKEGTPWVTKLPFPVQCVSKVTVKDKWRQSAFSNSYIYHHGYYDYNEREFRGFGRVDQVDTETYGKFLGANSNNRYITADNLLYQPPVLTKTWYHTGAFIDKQKILSQFAHEYYVPEGFVEHNLPEPDLNGLGLTTAEYRQALRSCKGMPLRQEVYEIDVKELEKENYKPVKLFSTAFHNCNIRLLQPQGVNPYAVFLTTASEALTFNYELDLTNTIIKADPRISHTFNLQTDEYGNVLETIAVVYPRVESHTGDLSFPVGAGELITKVQHQLHLSYTVNKFTTAIINHKHYRLPLPCQVQTFELTGVKPDAGSYFSFSFLKSLLKLGIAEIDYHILPHNELPQKRMVECVRILYFDSDLIHPKPFGDNTELALPYETYKLALTADLLKDTLGDKLVSLQIDGETEVAMLQRVLSQGGYHLQDGMWWIRSGIAGYESDAADHFYLPERYTDPFNNTTTLSFDKEYDLYLHWSEDVFFNRTTVEDFDFRVLAPTKLIDINDNITEVAYDILGMPAAMAVKGKDAEGDSMDGIDLEVTESNLISFFKNQYNERQAKSFLSNASARYMYYTGEITAEDGSVSYTRHPACAAVLTREKHVAQLNGEESPLIAAFQYSDGMGSALCSKVQTEPENDTGELRWIVDGKTILNNKGKPVKKYEPYFTDTNIYAETEEKGVTSILYYDSAGRVIRTDLPDGSYSRVEFSPWHTLTFDQNDTTLEPDNKWYKAFSESDKDAEKQAAKQAAGHANTPVQTFLDSLGREVIVITHNKWPTKTDSAESTFIEEKYLTYTKLDAEGKPLWIQDPRGNRVMQYIYPPLPDTVTEGDETTAYTPCYDIAGNLLFQHSMDSGNRWTLIDAAGKPFYSWDENERQNDEDKFVEEQRLFHTEYDGLHRPVKTWLTIKGAVPVLIEQVKYRDNKDDSEAKELNLRGQIYQHYDGAGVVTNLAFDFKGNLLKTQKQLAAEHKATIIDWQDGSATSALLPEIFIQQTKYDALNRMVQLYNWHRLGAKVTVYQPAYNRRGLLEAETLFVKADKNGGGFTGGERTEAVSKITYDAKGQIQRIYYGNGTATRYYYDKYTFRLKQLRTTRKDIDAALPVKDGLKDARVLQNLYYTYDPVGNITQIYDDAFEPAFFNNQQVKPQSTFTYDALYRLIEATGRENSSLDNAPAQQENKPGVLTVPNGAANVLRQYTQQYSYDAAGNITLMSHKAGVGAQTQRWTRLYTYATGSNRLLQTETGDSSAPINYKYDTHGSLLNLANTGADLYSRWDYRDMIHSLNRLGGGWAWYQYDNSKQRTRKVIERNDGTREERWYLGGMEWYRHINSTGEVLEEIETYHLFAGEQRTLIVEDVIKTDNEKLRTGVLCRYQYSNHLGSVGLEADEDGNIISYEEYHPYGTPAYTAQSDSIKCTAKRYRYTGMERDEESGLNYHTARYYAPWLGRWCSADPIGLEGGPNVFSYCNDSPTKFKDLKGLQPDGTVVGGASDESQTSEAESRRNLLIRFLLRSNPFFSSIYGALSAVHLVNEFLESFLSPSDMDALMSIPVLAAPEMVAYATERGFLEAEIVIQRATPFMERAALSMDRYSLMGSNFLESTFLRATERASGLLSRFRGQPNIRQATETTEAPMQRALSTIAREAEGLTSYRRPPTIHVGEIKPDTPEAIAKAFHDLTEVSRTGYWSVGSGSTGGGRAGIAVYNRTTGEVRMIVHELDEAGGLIHTPIWEGNIGSITAEELAVLERDSGGRADRFGNLVEEKVRAIVSRATGQVFESHRANGSGPDLVTDQLPLPYVH